jgi:hypothetical protein
MLEWASPGAAAPEGVLQTRDPRGYGSCLCAGALCEQFSGAVRDEWLVASLRTRCDSVRAQSSLVRSLGSCLQRRLDSGTRACQGTWAPTRRECTGYRVLCVARRSSIPKDFEAACACNGRKECARRRSSPAAPDTSPATHWLEYGERSAC